MVRSMFGDIYAYFLSSYLANLCIVVCHRAESLAMVLRDENVLEYPRDDFNDCGVELLALGNTWRCF